MADRDWLYANAQVTCRLHGPMRLDHATGTYVCEGFDGEGCDRRVPTVDLSVIGLLRELERRGML